MKDTIVCTCGHNDVLHRDRGKKSCRKCECKQFKKAQMTDEGHPIGCTCTSCRVARLESTINEMSFRISLLSSWAEVQWKKEGMTINPITGSITTEALSILCKQYQEEFTAVSPNTVQLYAKESVYGGINFLLIMDEGEIKVRRIGITTEEEYVNEIISIDKCFEHLKDEPNAEKVKENLEKSKQVLLDLIQKQTESET